MDKIKRFIGCNIPVHSCNFRCEYCYLTHHKNAYSGKNEGFQYPIDYMAKCLSKERLGGACYFNMCAPGETTLQKDLFPLIRALIKEGHYCDIITNLSLSKKVDEFLSFFTPEEYSHIFIKASFHYLQLIEHGLLNVFVDNIKKLKNASVSYTIEITPHDALVPYIEEIKEFSMKNFGALPHITVARNEETKEIALLSKYTKEEYKKVWKVFDSPFFDFKLSIFNEKVEDFCYAGRNSIILDLYTGNYQQCYCGHYLGNIYKNPNKALEFLPIGKCNMAHCFNGHALIAFAGNVPDLKMNVPTFAEERNRVCLDGSEWLTQSIKEFFSTRASETNPLYNKKEQKDILRKNKSRLLYAYCRQKMQGLLRRVRMVNKKTTGGGGK